MKTVEKRLIKPQSKPQPPKIELKKTLKETTFQNGFISVKNAKDFI